MRDKRIFIAINLPEKVKDELEKIKQEIIASFPEEVGAKVGKWVKKDNLHITLLFIGEVKDEFVQQLCQIVNEAIAGFQPFTVKFSKVCYGPTISEARPQIILPRLIWAEVEQNKNLERLAEELKKQMAQAGVLRRIEKRPFSGHITLARIRQWGWRQIEPDERPDIERELDLSFEVKSVDVMESVLKRTGAEYVILQSIRLT